MLTSLVSLPNSDLSILDGIKCALIAAWFNRSISIFGFFIYSPPFAGHGRVRPLG